MVVVAPKSRAVINPSSFFNKGAVLSRLSFKRVLYTIYCVYTHVGIFVQS